ncbi:MAG: response regulator [Myxococcales bacterium]|nr:response regulator [Myxococcales bacterium]
MSTRILVVDDSATIRDQVRRALTPAGFEVTDARDGVEGLARIEEEPETALVLCDVHMPRMDGLEMIERLKAAGNARPVLMLTTEGHPDLIRRAKASGARGWIIKPFDPALLVRAVQTLAVQR